MGIKNPQILGTNRYSTRDRAPESASAGENQAIARLEKNYLNGSLYIACIDWNFEWTKEEVNDVIQLWKIGAPLDAIAKNFARDKDETAILIMDLVRSRKIKHRPGGYLGKG